MKGSAAWLKARAAEQKGKGTTRSPRSWTSAPTAGRSGSSSWARLDLARIGADQFRLDLAQVDLRATLGACAEVWRVRCERQGVEFRLELPPAPAVVTTDPRRIRQVLDGLAENALRVTPAGARLTMSLSQAGPELVTLQVRDGGPGLAPEDYAVAFERGVLNQKYRGRRPVGSGIGLALAHGLVTRLGGTLTAGPAPEGGAAFTIQLPAT